jgi:hypothetical protein
MNVYNYLFYRIYKRQNTKFGKQESTFFASMIVSCLVFFNLFTLTIFLFKLDILPTIEITNIRAAIFGIIILGLNTWMFFKNKKYLRIENKFTGLTKKKNGIGLFFILLYVVMTFVIFIIAVNYGR